MFCSLSLLIKKWYERHLLPQRAELKKNAGVRCVYLGPAKQLPHIGVRAKFVLHAADVCGRTFTLAGQPPCQATPIKRNAGRDLQPVGARGNH